MKTDGQQEQAERKKPNFFKVVLSTMAAAFGVQSRRNLEEDFQQSSPFPFIVAGVVFTLLFVLALIFIVDLVLSQVP